jgi:Ca2+-transporting ATPase
MEDSTEPAKPSTLPDTWHDLERNEVVDILSTSPETGLSEEQAAQRLERFGPNRLEEAPPTSLWEMLWEQFNNFIVLLLIVAAIVSALLGEWVEAGAIFAIVVLNAALGIVQEYRAQRELAALRQLAAPDAQVLRDGHRHTIPARQLVPGDIISLEAGNFVPADVRLLEAVNLRI